MPLISSHAQRPWATAYLPHLVLSGLVLSGITDSEVLVDRSMAAKQLAETLNVVASVAIRSHAPSRLAWLKVPQASVTTKPLPINMLRFKAFWVGFNYQYLSYTYNWYKHLSVPA
jgi:hypothetical protein